MSDTPQDPRLEWLLYGGEYSTKQAVAILAALDAVDPARVARLPEDPPDEWLYAMCDGLGWVKPSKGERFIMRGAYQRLRALVEGL